LPLPGQAVQGSLHRRDALLHHAVDDPRRRVRQEFGDPHDPGAAIGRGENLRRAMVFVASFAGVGPPLSPALEPPSSAVYSSAGMEWCSCVTHHSPSILRNPRVSRNRNPLELGPGPQRMMATAKATSSPAVMVSSSISNSCDGLWYWKNRSQVFLYSAIPLHCSGGGRSNITISGACRARMAGRSCRRTASAQVSMSVLI